MKRLLTICLAVLSFSFASFAQTEIGTGYIYGLASAVSKASDGYESNINATCNGVFFNVLKAVPIVDNFKFKTGISYTHHTSTECAFLAISDDPRYQIIHDTGSLITIEHYIHIPILFGFTNPLIPNLNSYCYVGTSLTYGLSSKSYTHWPGVQGVNHWNVDHFDEHTNYNGYHRLSMHLSANIGLEVLERVNIELGGSLSFRDHSATKEHRLTVITMRLGLNYIFSSREKNFH